jgi:indole-3-glycerol phosphate synthase
LILERIVNKRTADIEAKKATLPLSELAKKLVIGQKNRAFLSALTVDGISLIAETKKASPSKGIIKENYNPADLALEYEAGGASAISVLTEPSEFLGDITHISAVKEVCGLPILQKDFIFDPYQIYEGKLAGADAILLIAAMLNKSRLERLLKVADELFLDALVEVHCKEELKTALSTSARAIGINNRNLKTFETSLNVTKNLAPVVKKENRILVSESGICTREDIEMLEELGVDAVLIGGALMTSESPRKKISELLGIKEGVFNG